MPGLGLGFRAFLRPARPWERARRRQPNKETPPGLGSCESLRRGTYPKELRTRRILAAAALSLLGCAARADEAAYLAARDRAIAAAARDDKSGKTGGAFYKRREKSLKALAARLKAAIGPVAAAGFAKSGKISRETLSSGDIDLETLDGLVFAGEDGKFMLLASTKGLLDAWLRERSREKDAAPHVPENVAEALRSENFYTFALGRDRAVSKYAEPTIPAPPGAAAAILDARGQESPPPAPDEVTVALVIGNRVQIASEPLKSKIEPIAAYAQRVEAVRAEAGTKRAAHEASGGKNDKLLDEAEALERKADAEGPACFAARAEGEPFYAAASAQARDLAERLANRDIPPATSREPAPRRETALWLEHAENHCMTAEKIDAHFGVAKRRQTVGGTRPHQTARSRR